MSICDAIKGRQVIEFDYDSHHRIVQPAAAGPHVTTGNPVLRGYQVGGTGKTREVPFWDLFLIEKIRNLVILEETFDADPLGYQRGDKHITIQCEL